MAWSSLCTLRLANEHVLLRPLAVTDRPELATIAFDDDIWRYFVQRVVTDADLDAFLRTAIDDTAAGRRIVFGVVDRSTGRLAGSMAYGNLAEADRRVEIGWSWLGADHRGKGINRWAKFLLLDHAFERLGCERVEFKTDVLNIPARRGLANIGATEEGVFRSYNYMPGGRRRDAVWFSVLRPEWPVVRDGLIAAPKLAAPASALLG